MDLFAARGYEAVGIQEIVQAAGITKPTLYHYFGSKGGLLAALLARHSARLLGAVTPAAAYRGDLPGTLAGLVRAYFAFAEAEPRFYRLQLALWFAPPSSEPFRTVAPFHAQQYALVETLFAQAAADHGNLRGRQRAYATTLLGMINSYIGMALNGYTRLDDALVRQAVQQFMYGIFS